MFLSSDTDSDQDVLLVYSGRNRTGSEGLVAESENALDVPSWDTVAREIATAYWVAADRPHQLKV